jgi:hypothetical protein
MQPIHLPLSLSFPISPKSLIAQEGKAIPHASANDPGHPAANVSIHPFAIFLPFFYSITITITIT